MDFVKGLFDSDKEEESGSARQTMNKNYDKADKYHKSRKKTKATEDDINGVSRRPNKSNKVEPVGAAPGSASQSIPMKNLDATEERPTIPPRPKSRAVILPSGIIISSDDDSSVHTSTLSSHSSDSFNPNHKLADMVGLEVEDVDNGKFLQKFFNLVFD